MAISPSPARQEPERLEPHHAELPLDPKPKRHKPAGTRRSGDLNPRRAITHDDAEPATRTPPASRKPQARSRPASKPRARKPAPSSPRPKRLEPTRPPQRPHAMWGQRWQGGPAQHQHDMARQHHVMPALPTRAGPPLHHTDQHVAYRRRPAHGQPSPARTADKTRAKRSPCHHQPNPSEPSRSPSPSRPPSRLTRTRAQQDEANTGLPSKPATRSHDAPGTRRPRQ